MCLPKRAEKPKRILVIGGGYAGQSAGKLLDGDFEVTVVEPRDFLVHKIAGVRACVRPEWADALLVPQQTALTRGKRVKASVAKISTNTVHLADGKTLPFDYLILASGGTSLSPAEPRGSENLKKDYEDVAHAIESAKHILVVGGGPVGVELIGEIHGKFAEKQITLVHAGAKLVDNVKATPEDKFHEEIKTKLEAKNVNIKLGVKAEVDFNNKAYLNVQGPVKLSDGSSVEAVDLVLLCAGYKPNTEFVEPAWLDERRLVKVNQHMQVTNVAAGNVFAIGDCNDVKETKTYVVCGTQVGKTEGWPRGHADIVNDNIRAIEKKAELVKYTPNTQWFGMILPIGPNDSVVAGYPEGFGAYKSATYFIGNQYEIVGLPVPSLPSL
jgi:NADH dehydrogenase FAD-containing subunit